MPITTTPAAPLTADQLPAFAEQLQSLKAELLARVRQQRGGEVSRADAAAEVRAQSQDDWAQTDAERELSVTLEERELADINDIVAAQQRLADGSFGECGDCGSPIGLARLQANPVALRCIRCQTLHEQHTGQAHAPQP
jgi:DnaK suppressor protein